MFTPSNTDFFGWDMLYRTIESAVLRKSDVLIALTHFVLMKYANFRCLGIGEDKTFSDDEVGSELLPDGWNDDGNRYALRYVGNGQLYLLLGYTSENCFIINLLDVKTRKVSNLALEPEKMVKKIKGSINELVPEATLVSERIRKELVYPVYAGSSREVTTQTNINDPGSSNPLRIIDPLRTNDPLRIGDPMRSFGPQNPLRLPQAPRPFGLPEYGASDLDPLGRLGQGNIFPFPQRPSFHGSEQPRFDPFGPPDRNIPPNPDPDHLPAPGFRGNYFS